MGGGLRGDGDVSFRIWRRGGGERGRVVEGGTLLGEWTAGGVG